MADQTPQEIHDAKVQQAVAFLTNLRDGSFLVEAYDGIQTAMEGQARIHKPASVHMAVTFTPAGDDAVSISAEVQTKLPPTKARAQTFFGRKAGLPSRSREAQAEMNFPRPVEAGKAVNE